MLQLLYVGLLGLFLMSLLIFKLTQRIARATPQHQRYPGGNPDVSERPIEPEDEEVEDEPRVVPEAAPEIEGGEEPPIKEDEIAATLEEIEDGEAETTGGEPPEGYDRDMEAAFVGIEPEVKEEEGPAGREEKVERDKADGKMEAFPEEKLEEAAMGYEGEREVVAPGMAEAPRPETVAPPAPPLPPPEERVKEEKAKAEPPEVPSERDVEEMEVGEGTSAAGMTVSQTNLKALSGAVIAAIERGGRAVDPEPGEKILVGDKLIIKGTREARERAKVILQEEVRRIHLQQVIDQLAKKRKDLDEVKELKKSVVVGKVDLLESLEKRHKELMEAYEKGIEIGESGGTERPAGAIKVAEEPAGGAGKKPKKRPKEVSPREYRECFGNAEDYEKCKRDCGSVDECAKAVKLLEDV